MSLINREDLIAEYDRVHIGPPGGARKLMVDAPEVKPKQLERCPIYRAVCNYPSDECYDCPRHDPTRIANKLMMPEPKWIPCKTKKPEGVVLVTVETKTFKHRYVCEAVWIPRWTWKASFDNWEDCSEYNEDEDEYYVLEGWYERVHNWDDYSYIGIKDNVIAWQPLPEPFREEGEK